MHLHAWLRSICEPHSLHLHALACGRLSSLKRGGPDLFALALLFVCSTPAAASLVEPLSRCAEDMRRAPQRVVARTRFFYDEGCKLYARHGALRRSGSVPSTVKQRSRLLMAPCTLQPGARGISTVRVPGRRPPRCSSRYSSPVPARTPPSPSACPSDRAVAASRRSTTRSRRPGRCHVHCCLHPGCYSANKPAWTSSDPRRSRRGRCYSSTPRTWRHSGFRRAPCARMWCSVAST